MTRRVNSPGLLLFLKNIGISACLPYLVTAVPYMATAYSIYGHISEVTKMSFHCLLLTGNLNFKFVNIADLTPDRNSVFGIGLQNSIRFKHGKSTMADRIYSGL